MEGGKFDEIKPEWLKDRASGLSVCTGSGVFFHTVHPMSAFQIVQI